MYLQWINKMQYNIKKPQGAFKNWVHSVFLADFAILKKKWKKLHY